ncbi:MAG: Na+/H+ antiporter NhaA, partial [Acidimicrobiia bacterium]|nr:Na+/H+ antiporter NhaA [Acidimicrobiia bacterium]
IVLLAATILALIWANSAWGDSYFEFWDIHLSFEVGGFHFDQSLKHVVDDGLMAIFFFVVGLEIKRELVVGELNSVKKASLPAVAALGGMVVPALIYVAFVASSGPADALAGWGIPMATDIAFSVGVIALLSSRVPLGAKLFLLALAIVDDIGAILVIAIFYTDDLAFIWLIVAAAALALIAAARQAGIRAGIFYLPLAILTWYAFLESGVHATVAGVILGLLVPARAYYSDVAFRRRAGWILERWDRNAASPQAHERLDHDALELAAIAKESVSPLERWEHALHPWSSFVVIPLFALANAGVRFVNIDIVEAVTSPVALGVSVGLIVGKPVGIVVATWLGLKLKLGELPRHTSFGHIIGLGFLAGVGFTVSLFIAELAFRSSPDAHLFSDEAKIGIFIGSIVAGITGYTFLRLYKARSVEG